MYTERRAYIELHIAVLLFGVTAILGELIQLSALMLVWWRMLLAVASLYIIIRWRGIWQPIAMRLGLTFAGIGFIVAIHWLCFFGAIKLSNVSITLVCMATATSFTAIIEPLLLRRPFLWYELLLGLMMIPGMALVVGGVEGGMLNGVWVGLLSAFLAAVFSILNKKYVERAPSLQITFIELGAGWLLLSALMPFFPNAYAQWLPLGLDWLYLGLLAIVCTTLAYVLALRSLRQLSAFASTLAVNLEPIYGILLAWWLFNENEDLTVRFYWGGGIIVGAVIVYPWFRKWNKRRLQAFSDS